MRYNLKIKKNTEVRTFIDVLSCLYPFSDLPPREKDVLASFINGYLEYKKSGLSDSKAFSKVFNYEYLKKMSEDLSTKDKVITLALIRNYTTKLRKKGLLNKKTIVKKFLVLFENIGTEMTYVFKFEKDEDNK